MNFFSEVGLRYFLPAYLIADLWDQLLTADPLFVLVYGFSDIKVKYETKSGVFTKKIGKTAFVNPRRYGVMMGWGVRVSAGADDADDRESKSMKLTWWLWAFIRD